MPTYTAHDIANYFLFKADQEGQELLSNMKLQKLLYYAQGIHLALGNGPLFPNIIRSWTYGPVIPDVYHSFKGHGSGCIPAPVVFNPDIIDPETKEFLDEIFDIFGQFSAIRLMEISHSDQCWQDAMADCVITHQAMTDCLKKYVADE